MIPTAFTIRIYGLLIHEDAILLSKENIHGDIYVKFPGGGLEFGEGVIDCLKREFMEEVQIDIKVGSHFYTTEDYFPSAFHADPKQVLCIYYTVVTDEIDQIKIGNPTDEHLLKKDQDQILYWCALKNLDKEVLKLPIDKIVVEKLLQSYITSTSDLTKRK